MIFSMIVAAAWPPLYAVLMTRLTNRAAGWAWWRLPLYWAGCGIAGVVAGLTTSSWPVSAVSAGHILVAAAIWWHRRRKKRGAAPLGAKSKARIEAMVRTMKQRARPRGAVRPVPGGSW